MEHLFLYSTLHLRDFPYLRAPMSYPLYLGTFELLILHNKLILDYEYML